jgi:hypothetical protein
MRYVKKKSNTWIDWPIRAAAIALLAPTSAVELCEKAFEFYEKTVLTQAQTRATIIIP